MQTPELAPKRSRRWELSIALATTGLAVTSWATLGAVAVAQHPEPMTKLGRITGAGYGDGYHACKSSGHRLLADLPPTSYANRIDVAKMRLAAHGQQGPSANTTFYDRFDQACDEAAVQHSFMPEAPGAAYPGYRPQFPVPAPLPSPSSSPLPLAQPAVTAPGHPTLAPQPRPAHPSQQFEESECQDPVALEMWRAQQQLHREATRLREEKREQEWRVYEQYKVDESAPESATNDDSELPVPSPSDNLDSQSRRSTSTPLPMVLSDSQTRRANPSRLPKAIANSRIFQPNERVEPTERVATVESLIIRQPQ